MKARCSFGIIALFALMACGRNKPTGGSAVTQSEKKLGVSPATWPQEGPAPIGDMNPANFNSDVTGAVHRLVVDPSNPATVYAGSANGGIWKTTVANAVFGSDAGAPTRPHWDTHTDGLPSLTIGALAMDPTNSLRLVAGTGARSNGLPPGAEGLVYVTNDGGGSWSVIDVAGNNPDGGANQVSLRNKSIRGIAVRGQLILVAAVQGSQGFLFRSTNGGTAWTSLGGTGDLPATFGPAYDLVADPSNSDRYYLVTADLSAGGSGVYLIASSQTSITRISANDVSPKGLPPILKVPGISNAKLAIGPTEHYSSPWPPMAARSMLATR